MAHVAGILRRPFFAFVDPNLGWRAEVGIAADWWTAHYPSVRLVAVEDYEAEPVVGSGTCTRDGNS